MGDPSGEVKVLAEQAVEPQHSRSKPDRSFGLSAQKAISSNRAREQAKSSQASGPNVRSHPKDARELVFQLTQTGNDILAQDLVGKFGYDEDKIRQALEAEAKKDPEAYSRYKRALSSQQQWDETSIQKTFAEFKAKNPVESLDGKLRALKEITIDVDSGKVPEHLVKIVKAAFPSGNYLVHGSKITDAIQVLEDGFLASVSHRDQKGQKVENAHGGYSGISFSYDGVGAIPGDPRHLAAFITSPEAALNDQTKLTPPFLAAQNELQLVSKKYNREQVAEYIALADFLGISRAMIMDESSVLSCISNISDPETWGNGYFYLEEELKKIRSGEINIDNVGKLYSYKDGVFSVSPSENEGELSSAAIYTDFLLHETEAGQKLGKTLKDISLTEIAQLFKENEELTKSIFRQITGNENTIDIPGTSIAVDQIILMVPDTDYDHWATILATLDQTPLAIFTYSHLDGPRMPNWKFPEGHHEKFDQAINKGLAICKVIRPNLNFATLFASGIGPDDIVGRNVRHIKWEKLRDASEITRNENSELITALPE